ncbi:GNAT superfamily N-acetyltransferase [Catenuloplanes nepalensis]|uniref:GNAT superfamily N-acetyltransferase n=1 Tax=Catenuloplanes nepalensis TaxID=587533 RepID=A0ABT9N6R4_9ACTN|nr:GNAT family N-acetyltransferase [Catenuloplanes nepalensis]MDP9799392.1 GNAT superfamily N-acetyltransferase [Catenuloplanes nepalensis]
MTLAAFIGEALNEQHETAHFDSGKADLDTWLREHALTAEAHRTGRTFVWQDGGRVAAYYTIAAHLVVREDLPRSLGRGNPGQIPAVLLARLALDKTLHGQGLGGTLLADALQRIVVATDVVAARFVVVDTIDRDAHGFYLHHGFREIPGTMRLVQKISDIAAAVGH